MLWFKSKANKLSVSALVVTGLALSACGFSPLYGQNAAQPYVINTLAGISVQPIEDRVGQMMRTQLQSGLTPKGAKRTAPQYELMVTLSESIGVLAVDQASFATRANLYLNGDYQLVRLSDHLEVISGSAKTVASYNVLSSDYATLQAQANARELAVKDLSHILQSRLAVHFKTKAPKVQKSNQSNGQGSGQINYGYPN